MYFLYKFTNSSWEYNFKHFDMFDMADRSTCERKKILEKMKNIFDDLFFIN